MYSSEVLSPNIRKSPTRFLDYTTQEYDLLNKHRQEVGSSGIQLDSRELDDIVKRFEEASNNERARVDSNLLRLTSLFTSLVHEVRNKTYNSLDKQRKVFHENVQYLRQNLANYKPEAPVLPEYNRQEIQARVDQTPENQRTGVIEEKLKQIYLTKRLYEGHSREKHHYNNLINKLRNAPQVLTERNDKEFSDLMQRLESGLRKAVDDYQPKGFKSYLEKRGPGSHLQVNARDYFAKKVAPNIHYFEPETKKLHLLPLPAVNQLELTPDQKPQIAHLDIEYTIPSYHGSVLTPEGKIFLMGGIDNANETYGTRRTYQFDNENMTLARKANMHTGRFGFGVTYSKGKIYAIGGISLAGTLANCEYYDVKTDQWQVIEPMANPAAHANVCNFKDLFIYKFGGYLQNQVLSHSIERYSLKEGRWNILFAQLETKNFLHPLSASAQINNNEILVFGGITEDRRNTASGFVLSVDITTHLFGKPEIASEVITSLGAADLPYADGFWDTQTIVQGNRLFALQNVTDHNGNVTGRRLLEYSSAKWKST